jgi:hypothetical protein
MRNDEVLYVVEGLEAQSPLMEQVRREYFPDIGILSRVYRRWYANRDAGLGANLTFAYFEAGIKLPKEIGWPAVRRAYAGLTTPTETRRADPACQAVLDFGHPINLRAQAILKGYLAAGLSYEQIAARFGRSVDFIRLFANLYFDFPERRESPEFIEGVLDPRGERGCFRPDLGGLIKIEDPALRLTNIGFHYGPETLCELLGSGSDHHTLPGEAESLKKANQWLLAGAHRKAMNEQLAIDGPEFSLMKILNQQQKEHPNAYSQTTPLEGMSISAGAQETLNAILQEQINVQLQALTGVSANEQPDYQI